MIEKIAWGAKVSPVFLDRARWIVDDLEIGYSSTDGLSKLMSCMAWESNETFAPDVKNMAGSGATGLIQFMPSTAKALGTTTTALAAMTAEDQLNYVWKYFSQWKGKLKTLGDLYMAILWPRGVGKSETYVLWDRETRPTTYRQNAGIDADKDGTITKAEATAKVAAKLSKGLSAPYVEEIFVNPVEHTEPEEATELPTDEVIPDDTTPAKDKADWWDRIGNLVASQLSGVLFIAGALLLNPDFSTKLGAFTLALAKGESVWGALSAVIGAGLLVIARMRDRQRPK